MFRNLSKNLLCLNLENNSIESIKQNDFNEIKSIKYLYIGSNRIQSVEANYLNQLNLADLYLENNVIGEIKDFTFNGLNNLNVLNLYNNSIDSIQSNGFFNSTKKKLIIKIPNVSADNLRSLKYSLKPKLVKKYYRYIYFDTIYIENRIDIDCVKTYFLMQSKLFLKFFNEHIDSTYVLTHC